ncbi:hypothetical protein SAMN04490248_13314 [Salinihabitans flavidus]|uniref:Uncharacterized protein n=1 Tax=Salinihabitans flavidus TaxID=569882 RepID=A0A1H8VT57_9RHOB|nr:DUF6064 family protein [Salinihabitans flavidus]SEP18118.1 hypothetical protein SAMN04490248_13314 [Salinihabitans flavidus]
MQNCKLWSPFKTRPVQTRLGRDAALFISATLAAMWAVNGVGYHWLFFREINPAAALFAALFVAQAILLVVLPVRSPAFRFATAAGARSVVGLLLILFAVARLSGLHFARHVAADAA